MPTRNVEKRRATRKAWYALNRERQSKLAVDRAKASGWKHQAAMRARRRTAGLPASGCWEDRWREYAHAAAKRGREYWPKGCRVELPNHPKAAKPRKPWHGLSDTDSYHVRYQHDAEFRQRERERISARRYMQPEYGAQWERVGSRWMRAASSNDGSIDLTLLRALMRERYCAYCGRDTRRTERHLDHVWPPAKGGTHSADNLVMACEDCNRVKRDTLPLQWLMRIARIAGPSDAIPHHG